MSNAFKEIAEYREFLTQYVLQTLRSKYRGSVLGFFWTLLNPLLLCLALSVVFSYINRANLRTYGVYFFGGYVPWLFFVGATSLGTGCIVGNSQYVSRIFLPKVLFPVWATLINVVDFAAGMAIVFILMAAFGASFSPALLVLPISILLLTVFALGLSFLFGALNVFLRDFQFLWGTVSFLWFFFTPILYPLANIPEGPRTFFALNPMVSFMQLFQDPISKGLVPPFHVFAYSSIYALAALVIGMLFFTRSEKSFYLYL